MQLPQQSAATNLTNLETRDFQFKASASAFKVLSSSLYENKPRAVLRELAANAWDAHEKAGCSDTPIEIALPTEIDPQLVVRDYGTGMTCAEAHSLYMTFFSSDKTDSNDQIGGFGLGSKSPYAIAEAFNVTTVKDGERTVIAAFIDAGIPASVIVSHEFDVDEPNGTTVFVPVANQTIRQALFDEAHDLFTYWEVQPNITLDGAAQVLLSSYSQITSTGVMFLEPKHSYSPQSASFGDFFSDVIIGNFAYPIPSSMFTTIRTQCEDLLQVFRMLNTSSNSITPMVIIADIGELEIAPSRERIEVTEENAKALIERIRTLSSTLVSSLAPNLKRYVDMLESLDYSAIDLGLPLYSEEALREFMNNWDIDLRKAQSAIQFVNQQVDNSNVDQQTIDVLSTFVPLTNRLYYLSSKFVNIPITMYNPSGMVIVNSTTVDTHKRTQNAFRNLIHRKEYVSQTYNKYRRKFSPVRTLRVRSTGKAYAISPLAFTSSSWLNDIVHLHHLRETHNAFPCERIIREQTRSREVFKRNQRGEPIPSYRLMQLTADDAESAVKPLLIVEGSPDTVLRKKMTTFLRAEEYEDEEIFIETLSGERHQVDLLTNYAEISYDNTSYSKRDVHAYNYLKKLAERFPKTFQFVELGEVKKAFDHIDVYVSQRAAAKKRKQEVTSMYDREIGLLRSFRTSGVEQCVDSSNDSVTRTLTVGSFYKEIVPKLIESKGVLFIQTPKEQFNVRSCAASIANNSYLKDKLDYALISLSTSSEFNTKRFSQLLDSGVTIVVDSAVSREKLLEKVEQPQFILDGYNFNLRRWLRASLINHEDADLYINHMVAQGLFGVRVTSCVQFTDVIQKEVKRTETYARSTHERYNRRVTKTRGGRAKLFANLNDALSKLPITQTIKYLDPIGTMIGEGYKDKFTDAYNTLLSSGNYVYRNTNFVSECRRIAFPELTMFTDTYRGEVDSVLEDIENGKSPRLERYLKDKFTKMFKNDAAAVSLNRLICNISSKVKEKIYESISSHSD